MMIAIGQNTYGQVEGQFEMSPLGKAILKGEQNEVMAYEVIGRLQSPEAERSTSTDLAV